MFQTGWVFLIYPYDFFHFREWKKVGSDWYASTEVRLFFFID